MIQHACCFYLFHCFLLCFSDRFSTNAHITHDITQNITHINTHWKDLVLFGLHHFDPLRALNARVWGWCFRRCSTNQPESTRRFNRRPIVSLLNKARLRGFQFFSLFKVLQSFLRFPRLAGICRSQCFISELNAGRIDKGWLTLRETVIGRASTFTKL